MSGKMRYVRKGAFALIGVLLLAISQTVAAQEAKPQETKGATVNSTDLLGLGAQLPEIAGYALRIRKITLEPGAVIAHHSHAKRPIVIYVISGAYTEVPDEGPEITHGPGTQWVEGAEMKHWGGNRGQEPTVLIAVDIVPEE